MLWTLGQERLSRANEKRLVNYPELLASPRDNPRLPQQGTSWHGTHNVDWNGLNEEESDPAYYPLEAQTLMNTKQQADCVPLIDRSGPGAPLAGRSVATVPRNGRYFSVQLRAIADITMAGTSLRDQPTVAPPAAAERRSGPPTSGGHPRLVLVS
ncbi:hypothetical protein KIN20_005454 [Parelaphostrongylus tenuis]|uniref:Uncharacterized protein n=1 Tax=Parelaphostrongylus tenuis TaxID=148309 RepID=A0AAD5M0D3_PARTN|nr:hypothetical protein KIN20_005454 [Parelaphostrongylus tenuis]